MPHIKTDSLKKNSPALQRAVAQLPGTGKGLSQKAVPFLQPGWQSTVQQQPVVQRTPTRALPLAGGEERGEVKLGKTVHVKGDAGKWLEKGSQVILLIKQLILPFGSGNVVQSIEGSKSESLNRLTAFRNMSYLDPAGQNPPVTVGTQQMKDLKAPEQIIQAAIAAAVVQGGNCLQNGEIVFALLNLLLDAGTPIALVQPGGCDHAFTVAGDVPDGPVTEDIAKSLVCIDAWPHVAKACLLADSAFGTWEKAYLVRGKAAGGGLAGPFFAAVEAQKKLVQEFSESREAIKDRTIRGQRNNLRTAMELANTSNPRQPTEKDFQGAFNQMTIFNNDIVPQYIVDHD